MGKKAKIAAAWTLTAGILAGTAAAAAERPIRLIVNGTEAAAERPPIIVDGSAMVPIRAAAEALGKDVQWNGERAEVTIADREELLTQYAKEDRKVELWGTKRDRNYWGMKMTFGNKSRNFPFWYNVGNRSYAPRILLEDVNQDGGDELLVILTTGYGTGLKMEEAHLFDGDSFDEIPVEAWNTYALRHVRPGSVTEEGARISIDGEEMLVPHGILAAEFKNDSARWWYERPAYGQVVRYEVRDGALYALLPLWFSPAHSAGQLEIRYTYRDGFYQGESVRYTEE